MSKADQFPRLKPILKYVPKRLKKVAAENPKAGWNVEYRWTHTLRVAHYGALIAQKEGCDVELALAGCLLHDVARFDPGKPQDHGRLGAEIIKPKLKEWGFKKKERKEICLAVASHVDVKNPETLLAKVVTDADNIDRFSALRILHFCDPDIYNYEKLIRKTAGRLKNLEKYEGKQIMETKAGQKLFDKQLKRMQNFYRDLIAEKDLTVFPPPSLNGYKD